MKKFLLILLAAGLVFSLCACGGGTKEAVSAAAADANSALTDAALAVSAAEGVQDAASQAPAAESAQETASQALPGVQNVVSAALQEQLGIVNSQTDPAESIAACEIRPSISLLQLESYVRGVPLIEGVKEVTLPGDPERRTLEQRRKSGIVIDDGNWKAFGDAARSLWQ